ncbi:flavohemoprotein [Grosmannia clavigera kw1407]|uniref:nitric oxide dioxygenase n=1 Tax=Grosmannia clavigera (strain kw1407 / UAMH 11150) TaxID=655863 RepID=F0XSA6_GROCL|nr:flavohemoprotein [Grosmannia clavigera kw1407]EFW99615.1 flavohemoprotein [Grosmannia clavigera kw1407]
MALTYKQSKLVRESIPHLREHGERISSIFYATMLDEHPELRSYFNTVNQQNGRQPRALTTIILAFATNISHTSELIPRLERVCHKHCSLGIQPQQYAIVGEYLIRAFRDVLGTAMTTELQSAWTDAYCVLARMMMGRESHLYRSFETWQGWRPLRVERKVAESDDVYSFYLVPYVSVRMPLSDESAMALLGQNGQNGQAQNVQDGQNGQTQIGQAGPDGRFYQARQYSLSDRWRPNCYRISVKRDEGTRFANAVSSSYFHPGVVSNALIDSVEVGDTIEVSHPTGEFFLNPRRAVTYVHGTHNGPPVFDAQIRDIQRRHPRLRTAYFYSGRPTSGRASSASSASSAHSLRRLRVSGLGGGLGDLDFHGTSFSDHHHYLSVQPSTALGSHGVGRSQTYEFTGRIDLSRLVPGLAEPSSPMSDHTESPPTPTNATAAAHGSLHNSVDDDDLLYLGNNSTEYFVCGPEAFMLDMAVCLVHGLGVSRNRIRYELFSTGDIETAQQDSRMSYIR